MATWGRCIPLDPTEDTESEIRWVGRALTGFVASRSIRPRILKDASPTTALRAALCCIPLDPTEDTESLVLRLAVLHRPLVASRSIRPRILKVGPSLLPKGDSGKLHPARSDRGY